jgi:hypothetical protein
MLIPCEGYPWMVDLVLLDQSNFLRYLWPDSFSGELPSVPMSNQLSMNLINIMMLVTIPRWVLLRALSSSRMVSTPYQFLNTFKKLLATSEF